MRSDLNASLQTWQNQLVTYGNQQGLPRQQVRQSGSVYQFRHVELQRHLSRR